MTNAFTQLGVAEQLAEQLKLQGIIEPTPIQKTAIPDLLSGIDMIAQAQTGTGKTLAFTLPILQLIRPDKDHVQALILTPTRELAIQITAEVKKLASSIGSTVLACYGGQDVAAQVKRLKNAPHIIVATPGRLMDHMRRGSINIGKISHLVLDEADQMLHMGFLPEVESIIMQTPKARQTMLFSATMPEAIRKLAVQYSKNAINVHIKSERVTLDNIKQRAIETTDREKQSALLHLLQTASPFLAVIFCRTKLRAKKLTEALQDAGYNADELHGDLTQAKREQVMKKFRDMKLQILVATDVAARGLDVEGVSHVYNYDIPLDAESYIHRIGRTGRAGHTGTAITFVTQHDRLKLDAIERGISARLPLRRVDGLEVAPRQYGEDRQGSRDRDRKSKPGSGYESRGRSNGNDSNRFNRGGKGSSERTGRGSAERNNKGTAERSGKVFPRPVSTSTSSEASKARAKDKANPWGISKADLELAQGIKPRDGGKSYGSSRNSTSSRSNSSSSNRSSGGRSGGRSSSRNSGSRRK